VKILLFGPDPRFKGGIAQYNHYLAEAIVREGHTLLFIGFEKQYPSFIYPTDDRNADADFFATNLYEVERIVPSFPFISRTIKKRLTEFHPDVVIVPWWVWWWYPLSRSLISHTPYAKHIVIAHNIMHHEKSFLHSFLSRYTVSRILKESDLVVTHSRETQSDAQQLGVSDTVMLPHPIYPQFQSSVAQDAAKKELKFNSNETFFLFYGIIRRYKGIDIALEAISQVSHARLIIAGEVWDDSLKQEMEENPQVTLINSYITTEKAVLLFAAVDAFVLPYRSVSGSGVAAAVLPIGKPIICSDLPLFREYFPAEMCFVFKNENVDDLAKRFDEVKKELKKSDFLLNLQNSSVKICEERTWQLHIKAIVSHMESKNE